MFCVPQLCKLKVGKQRRKQHTVIKEKGERFQKLEKKKKEIKGKNKFNRMPERYLIIQLYCPPPPAPLILVAWEKKSHLT